LEVNESKDLVLIGTEKHVIMINCNLKNRDFSLAKNIVETNDCINQIKLMHKPNSTKEILVAVDNSGEIVVATIDLIKDRKKRSKLDKYEVVKTKKYNSKIDFNDNSPWSVDCQYPYIIIGSNNRTVFVFNYEDKQNEQNNDDSNDGNNNNNLVLNNNSVIYKGNNNNIPYVTISENGAFIGNNSIDKNFKIFDFYTGELICSCQNPNNEWGWGIKFIPQNLFKIQDFTFQDYEARKDNNFPNEALIRNHMSDLNLNNPSQYDENNINKIPYEDLDIHEKFIKINLIDKYYILSTCNHCAGLFKLDYQLIENKKTVTAIPLGKIELTRNYIRDLYRDKEQIDYVTQAMISGIKNFSRYEFIFYSKNLNLFLVGSKAGDLQVFEMIIYKDTTNNLIGVEDESNILITFKEKLSGMKFIDNSENGRKIIDVFVLTLSGTFYYYKIMPPIEG
jgi:hypothetical protein